MEKKNRISEVIENQSVIDISSDGRGVAKSENKVIFIKKAVPGDIVDVRVTKKKKNLLEGEILFLGNKSIDRIEPICEHFGHCGGCKWQNMTYEKQIFYKKREAVEQFKRIGKIEYQKEIPIIKAQKYLEYRNKLEFSFSNKRWLLEEEKGDEIKGNLNALGFHISQRFDKILHISECHLMDKFSNELRNFVFENSIELNLGFYDAKTQIGFLRNLLIRNSSINQWMLVLIVNSGANEKFFELMERIKNKFPELTSLQYIINNKRNDTWTDLESVNFYGKSFIEEKFEKFSFRISPQSFFQTNSFQGYELYKAIRDAANLKGTEVVYDLYSGTGSISIFISDLCRKIVGIEYVEQAVKDAKINAEINNISNCSFFAGDMKDLLNDEFFIENGFPDLIITDPPRSGMHPGVVNQLLKSKVEVIIYVSCNVSTQARDLEILSQNYLIETISLVDMFPQTTHLESIVKLILKKDIN